MFARFVQLTGGRVLSILGLFAGLGLLVWLTLRGTELLVAAPLCALLVALASAHPVIPELAGSATGPAFTTAYLEGFSGFIQSWFFTFLLGALFGKMMEATGAAAAVAHAIVQRLGSRHALLAVVLACAVLTYGGVSLFVVAFGMYPVALALFRGADLPRRFIPAALAFGSVTFTMTSAGSPEIQNLIPTRYLGTNLYAGWQVSLVVALAMLLLGQWWLGAMVRRARAAGEGFVAREDDPVARAVTSLPATGVACVPLAVVLVTSFLWHDVLRESVLVVALSAGTVVAVVLMWRQLQALPEALSAGALGALLAVANTAAVVGFGSVAKGTAGFTAAVAFMTSLPGSPLLGAAIAVSVIAGLTGSASGGQAIALPLLAPHYLGLGVDPNALHRVVAISSGGLDSLPHNGYVVTVTRAVCREAYAGSYPAVAALTVVVPVAGTALAIVLFSLG